MMAAAYAYACGDGPMPRELQRLNAIDRFGVQAVTGKLILGSKEMRMMSIAENITRWYEERSRKEQWAVDNPKEAAALTVAHRLAIEQGLIKE